MKGGNIHDCDSETTNNQQPTTNNQQPRSKRELIPRLRRSAVETAHAGIS
jgi:hypothetical protein